MTLITAVQSYLHWPGQSCAGQETTAELNMKFAEEATFFASFFKNHSVRPIPDPTLMLQMYKDKIRKKQRCVAKKEKAANLLMGKKREKEPEHNDDEV